MTDDAEYLPRNTSLFYPFFHNAFEIADATSYFWQPLLKAVGRTNLEFAGLQARQTRAVLDWTHQVMRPASPLDLYNANVELWSTMMREYLDSAPRLAAAVETAADAVAPTLLPTPPKRTHDTLILLDRRSEPERRVA